MTSKTSFSTINDKFLIRGLPVIISDTLRNHRDGDVEKSKLTLLDFIDDMYANMSDMINSEACNFETNLMMSQYAKLDKAMRILRNSLEKSEEEISPWFISFRNCRIKAVEFNSCWSLILSKM